MKTREEAASLDHFDESLGAERYYIWCKHHQKAAELNLNEASKLKKQIAEKDVEIAMLKETIQELDYCQKVFYEATKKVGW